MPASQTGLRASRSMNQGLRAWRSLAVIATRCCSTVASA